MNGKLWMVIVLLLNAANGVMADTTWVAAGNVWGEWTANHSPFIIQGDVHVPGGQTLIIGAGVRVYFDSLAALEVNNLGNFAANGALGDSVVFTTNPERNPSRWRGIIAHHPADTVRLSYCVIENMKRDSTLMEDDSIAHQAALLVEEGPGLNLSHSSLRNNYGSGFGGALEVEQGLATISECTFSGNRGGYGSAACLRCSADIEACLFENNFSWGGGAVYVCHGNIESSMSDCTFRDNYAFSDAGIGGGAIGHHAGVLHVTECSFLGDSLWQSFSSPWGGGAICSGIDFPEEPESLIATRCLFVNNQSARFGGAISIENGSIINCTVVGAASSNGGGAIFTHASVPEDTVRIINTIVAHSRQGCGIQTYLRTGPIRHCLVFGTPGRAFAVSDSLMGRMRQTNTNGDSCDVYENLLLDPEFADTAAGDYHLTAGSPCIDAGDTTSPPDSDGTVADIGAFYFEHHLTTDRTFILHPSAFRLSSYPNPFNPSTMLAFSLPTPSAVALTVFDILGRVAYQKNLGRMEAGEYRQPFDGSALPSGVYFACIQAGNAARVMKIVLMK